MIFKTKRPETTKTYRYGPGQEGGWGIPHLKMYYDMYQLRHLLTIIKEGTKVQWVKIQKELMELKEEEIQTIIYPKKDIKPQIERKNSTITGILKVWCFKNEKLMSGNSPLTPMWVH